MGPIRQNSVWRDVLNKDKEPFEWLAVVRRSLLVIEKLKLTERWVIAQVIDLLEKTGYSDTVVQNAVPLLAFSQKEYTVDSILKNVASVHENKQPSVVADCVALLKPIDDPWTVIDQSFKIVQSPVAKRCLVLTNIMKPSTPWAVLTDISRMFQNNHIGNHDALQQKIAALLKTCDVHTLHSRLFDLNNNLNLPLLRYEDGS